MNLHRLTNLFKAIITSIRSGQIRVLVKEARRRFYSQWTHYGLCRDLTQPFQAPNAKIPLTIRALEEGDVPELLDMKAPGISARGPYVRMHRLNFLKEKIGTCYVAVTEDGHPCYMQWLIGASQNDQIQEYFKGIFPALAPDEALLEYAFTPEAYQGQGIMPAAMARIAEKAAESGGRRVLTFVDHQNVPALKGCKRSGFMPCLTRTDKWRLFRRTMIFTPLPPGTPYPFDAEPATGEKPGGGSSEGRPGPSAA
jgi:RimJ/RimL family protein N-acetyltransferase